MISTEVVFCAAAWHTYALTDEEKNRVCGLIINKFRGDKTILDPGIQMLEERGRVPVTGVVPYMDVQLEDEDSLTERFDKRQMGLLI